MTRPDHPRDCDCCAGVDVRTPRSVAPPAGRAAVAFRVGMYPDFRATMQAELPGLAFPGGANPLARLTTRQADDPAVALLDAWAVAADVLPFYQERIAAEASLPTATE